MKYQYSIDELKHQENLAQAQREEERARWEELEEHKVRLPQRSPVPPCPRPSSRILAKGLSMVQQDQESPENRHWAITPAQMDPRNCVLSLPCSAHCLPSKPAPPSLPLPEGGRHCSGTVCQNAPSLKTPGHFSLVSRKVQASTQHGPGFRTEPPLAPSPSHCPALQLGQATHSLQLYTSAWPHVPGFIPTDLSCPASLRGLSTHQTSFVDLSCVSNHRPHLSST